MLLLITPPNHHRRPQHRLHYILHRCRRYHRKHVPYFFPSIDKEIRLGS